VAKVTLLIETNLATEPAGRLVEDDRLPLWAERTFASVPTLIRRHTTSRANLMIPATGTTPRPAGDGSKRDDVDPGPSPWNDLGFGPPALPRLRDVVARVPSSLATAVVAPAALFAATLLVFNITTAVLVAGCCVPRSLDGWDTYTSITCPCWSTAR
jgi:hypothetical protein